MEAAAQLCQISVATARRWRDEAKEAGDDWHRLRAAHTLAGGSVEELAVAMVAGQLVQYQTAMEELKNNTGLDIADKVKLLTSLSDSYNKTIAANARIMPHTNKLATALEVIEMMLAFAQENHPKHLQALAEILEPFGAVVEKKFG